jgi:multidrug efflux pump subunit AcrA (membrane-fusion protein)
MRLNSMPTIWIVAVLLLIGGFAAGLATPWSALRDRVAHAIRPAGETDEHGHPGDEHAAHENEADHADHVDLSPTARANLGLKTGRVGRSDFVRTLHIPGEVIEAPGFSTADVPARVAGVVSAIHVAPGQAVKPGDRLFELELTGDALAGAQAKLLDDIQQIETLQAEFDRLSPLAANGSVAAKQKLQIEYDLRRVQGQRQSLVQELLIRGLSHAQIDRIITNQELVKTVTIVVPPLPEPESKSAANEVSSTSGGASLDPWEYTVESIEVHPGESVAPEKSLARLARHARLYVRGHAFESDVPIVASVGMDEHVSVEFGGEAHGGIDGPVGSNGARHDHGDVIKGLKVLYLDNHVDPVTQTFAFYVPMENQVLRDVIDPQGRLFRSWKFKPGQRVHVRLPVETLKDRLVLPSAAVATEGPSSFVFRLSGRHAVGKAGPDGERQYEEEYRQVPVAVEYRDAESTVLANGSSLKKGDLIAMNRAYQIMLALKNAAEGGGGGHHEHDH